MQPLRPVDLAWCIRRLPHRIIGLMKQAGPNLVVAGGYVRSCVAREEISDVDMFSPTAADAKDAAQELCDQLDIEKPYETENALTVHSPHMSFAAQFIRRWTFGAPAEVVASFDFTVCQAAFWWGGKELGWQSLCADDFYHDLAAKRLVYTKPERNEDPGGSLLRILKYYPRGYRVPLDSLAGTMARLMCKAKINGAEKSEADCAVALLRELRVVDPAVDPLHEGHDPAVDEKPDPS